MLCRIVLIKLELDSEMTTFVMVALNLIAFVVRTISTVIILEIKKSMCSLLSGLELLLF